MKELITLLKKYIDTRTEIIKIEAQQEISKFVTRFFKLVIVGVLGFLSIIFISLGIALLLGDVLGGRMYIGFMIVGTFFMIILIILHKNHRKLSSIIRKYFNLNKSKIENDD